MKNEIVSCRETEPLPRYKEQVEYEHDNGQMIYAIIPADTVREANLKAMDLVKNISRGRPRA